MLGPLAVAERLCPGLSREFIAVSQHRGWLVFNLTDDAVGHIFFYCRFVARTVISVSHRFVFVSRCVSLIHPVASQWCLNIWLHSSTHSCGHSFTP